MDVENQSLNETSEVKPHDRPYFWTKDELYKDEIRIIKTSIPLWRALNTCAVFYTFYCGVDLAASLCNSDFLPNQVDILMFFSGTDATTTMTLFATFSACAYWLWATWWYDFPLNTNNFNFKSGTSIMLTHKRGHFLRI